MASHSLITTSDYRFAVMKAHYLKKQTNHPTTLKYIYKEFISWLCHKTSVPLLREWHLNLCFFIPFPYLTGCLLHLLKCSCFVIMLCNKEKDHMASTGGSIPASQMPKFMWEDSWISTMLSCVGLRLLPKRANNMVPSSCIKADWIDSWTFCQDCLWGNTLCNIWCTHRQPFKPEDHH